MTQGRPALSVGVSLKMYFGYQQTLEWMRRISALALSHPATTGGTVELFVAPSLVSLAEARAILRGTGVRLAAQNVAAQEAGPFTGEVSARELADLGCELVEIGHAERRGLFHEDDDQVAAKVARALTHELEPLLCVGELLQAPPSIGALETVDQLDRALADADRAALQGRLLVAYEPVWAIGQLAPAPVEHIRIVISALEDHLAARGRVDSRVIYGGSAGPGLLASLGTDIRGVFLGRSAHDPAGLELVLDEALTLSPE